MSEPPSPASESRWQLIRDLLVFQVKLGLDALRDLALSPISLVAAILDLVASADRERSFFYQVLRAGRRSERWIDLFGEADRIEPRDAAEAGERASLDRVVRRVEALVVEQYERGGVTAQAKAAIDRSLDALTRKRR
jgi:hypothetical protein